MKACVSCGKNLPDAAIICVFCRTRQHEERLDPTPVQGIRHDVPPVEAIAEAERGDPPAPRTTPARAPAPAKAPAVTNVPKPVADRDDRSVLIQLGQWNRNERATLSIAGLAMLAAVLAYDRTALPIIVTLAIAMAGIAPLPRSLRGAIALAGGLALLWKLFGPAAAGGLAILPGALLTRAKSPASRLAQLWGLASAGAVVAAFLIPRGEQTLARTILDGFKAEHFIVIATAVWLTLAVPLAVVGLIALAPRKTLGGCVLWATLMLLWAPVGILLYGFWSMTFVPSLAAAALALGSSTAGAVGLAELSV